MNPPPFAPAAAPLRRHGLDPALVATLGLWTVFTLLSATGFYLSRSLGENPLSPAATLVWMLPGYLFWASTIPGILALAHRLPWLGAAGIRPSALLVHLAAGVACALLHVALVSGVAVAVGAPAGRDGYLRALSTLLDVKLSGSLLTYLFLQGVSLAAGYRWRADAQELHGSRLQARASRLEAEVARAELLALRAQLNPHFLFNTLNSIALLVEEDPVAARRMVGRLDGLLRAALSGSQGQLASLEQELALLERYLDIERFRFGGRLRVELDVEPAALRVPVPVLLLQPLVENAVLHGIRPSPHGGSVRVRARREGRWLRLEVLDDGVGLPGGFQKRAAHRVGISNTRRRLQNLFGDDHRFAIGPGDPAGTAVVVLVPWPPAAATAGAGRDLSRAGTG